jgi:thioredoxin reductase (NADPH)
MTHTHTRVLIIGSGPAGYTAAIYAARANLKPVLVQGMQPGGQMTTTTDVENFPGFPNVIQGPWLMEQMQKQAEHVGTTMLYDTITEAKLDEHPFHFTGESGDTYSADAVIIATGASARRLGLPSEDKYRNFGVSGCATCDGFFFRNKPVVIIGGGNVAVEEAIYLSHITSHVTLVHRRDSLRAEKVLQDRLFAIPNIRVVWNSVLDEVLGTENPLGVTGARIKNVQTGATEEIPAEGIFIAIGHTPNSGLFKDYLELDAQGYILTKPDSTATNVPGVFAAGDIQDHVYRQAVTAAGTGCMAALEVDRYLSSQAKAV